jgi:hypothetical protein
VSHNTWDYKNALGRPLNDNIESWEVSQFEAKDHTFQTQARVSGFDAWTFKKTKRPKIWMILFM